MRHLIIFESPFQLITSLQFIEFTAARKVTIVFIETKNSKNSFQVEKLVALVLNKFHFIDYEYKVVRREGRRVKFAFNLLRCCFYLKQFKFDDILTGDVRSIYQRFIFQNTNFFRLVLVDDGIALINSIKVIDSFECYFKHSGSKVERFLNLLLPSITIGNYFVFSILPFHELKSVSLSLVENNYKQNFFNCSLFPVMEDEHLNKSMYDCIFIGGAIVQAGFIEENVYIELVCKLVERFFCGAYKKVLYLPHRRESLIQVSAIKNKLNCDVLHLESPVELEFMSKNIDGHSFVTFTSAALFTLNKIDPSKKFYYSKIEPSLLREDCHSSFFRMYSLFDSFSEEIKL